MADYIYDEATQNVDFEKMEPADVVFTNLSHLEEFFTHVHPFIRVPYILISHNHDYSAPGKFKSYLEDEKLVAWFTQNADVANHPKVIPIPIGLSNKHWGQNRDLDLHTALRMLSLRPVQKQFLLYVNVTINTNPVLRQPIIDYFRTLPFATFASDVPHLHYLRDVAMAKFVLSPHGNGLDCHRTWEALYMQSYPLVKTSTLDPLYEDLPVLIVNDWSEVTPDLLNAKFIEFSNKKFSFEKLYFAYWKRLVENKKNEFLNKG